MSEDIAQAAADRAAELAAIRARWQGRQWRLSEDGNSLNIDDVWAILADEPVTDEDRAFYAVVGDAPDDVRVLLARLDEATAAADAAIAEYSRFAAELQAARSVVAAARADIAGPSATTYQALDRALAAYDAARPADIARLFEE